MARLTRTKVLILTILDEAQRHELAGVDIAKLAKERTGGELTLSYGILYPALHSLEAEGSVEARDEKREERPQRPGRPRRYWRITKQGRRQLAEALKYAVTTKDGELVLIVG